MSDPHDVLREDPVMADLVDRHGPIEVSPVEDEFRRLCTSIINQQLSTASASAVRKRVFDTLEGHVEPETVLAADRSALKDAGLSDAKVEYVRNVAEAFSEQDLSREGLSGHSNDEVIEALTQIRGVGEWTARMYLIFALARPDVLPLGDLGVRNGIQQIYANGEELSRSEMRSIAEPWRPYRSYGTRYIWREYESD
ncbi:MAG: DNA-3-methyladenine glycosylase family protein [Natronomonas sp.]